MGFMEMNFSIIHNKAFSLPTVKTINQWPRGGQYRPSCTFKILPMQYLRAAFITCLAECLQFHELYIKCGFFSLTVFVLSELSVLRSLWWVHICTADVDFVQKSQSIPNQFCTLCTLPMGWAEDVASVCLWLWVRHVGRDEAVEKLQNGTNVCKPILWTIVVRKFFQTLGSICKLWTCYCVHVINEKV